ncbi:MAG: hypothetical protein WC755_00250 [Candidatus Woesearchaeota archaeon]|jgi:hypothetical protein
MDEYGIFYEKLCKKLQNKDINFLAGKNIAFNMTGKSDVLAKVISINKNIIYFQTIIHPFQEQTGFFEKEGELEIIDYSLNQTHYSFKKENEFNVDAYKVYTKFPKKIKTYNNKTLEFCYTIEDINLKKLIQKVIPKQYTNTKEVAQGINQAIHLLVPCMKIDPYKDYYDETLSVGQVIKLKNNAADTYLLLSLQHLYSWILIVK